MGSAETACTESRRGGRRLWCRACTTASACSWAAGSAIRQYFQEHSGSYYRSTGWLERGVDLLQLAPYRSGTSTNLADLIAKYGEDNGRYLYDQLTRFQSNYRTLTFIETGLECDGRFEEQARQEAAGKGWQFEKLAGDLRLLHRLVNGDWSSDDFLVVRPGQRIEAQFDENIVRAVGIAAPK